MYEKRYRELAEHYADRIHGWEVINETCISCDDTHAIPYFTEKGLVEESFKLAERYFPNNELIINESPWFVFMLPHYNVDRSPYYMNKKPAYESFDAFSTKSGLQTRRLPQDDRGRVEFNGFFGEYEIEINGKTYNIYLKKNASSNVEIVI